MKSNELKSVLLAALVAITILSFRHRPRTVVDSPPAPSWQGVPTVVAQPPPPPPAPKWNEKWDRYVYSGEVFSVEMPAMPFAYESSRRVGQSGNVEPVRTFGLYSDGVVLLVTSFANPSAAEPSVYLAAHHWDREVFASAGAVKAGTLRGEEYVSSGEFYRRARVFIVQNRAYLVCAMSLEPDDPRALHFLDSFDLGIDPKAKEIHETPRAAVKVSAEPYDGDEVVRKAVMVFKPSPFFPDEARKSGVNGAVRLRALLAADGKVRNVSVIKGLSHGLTKKSVDAARHILFFPAVKDGRAVSQYVTLEYEFNAH